MRTAQRLSGAPQPPASSRPGTLRRRPCLRSAPLQGGRADRCPETSQPASLDSPADWAERWQQMGKLGRGFVVWESNRTGRWRIWYRDLDGSGLRQLSPEEEGRDHFAPHISPDGTHLVYLSYPTPRNAYKSIPEPCIGAASSPAHRGRERSRARLQRAFLQRGSRGRLAGKSRTHLHRWPRHHAAARSRERRGAAAHRGAPSELRLSDQSHHDPRHDWAAPRPSPSTTRRSGASRGAAPRTAVSPTSLTTVAGDSGSRRTAVRCAGSIWSPGRRGTSSIATIPGCQRATATSTFPCSRPVSASSRSPPPGPRASTTTSGQTTMSSWGEWIPSASS